MRERACVLCSAPIFECMGFVLGRDFLAAAEGQKDWTDVREICGRCGILDEEALKKLEAIDG